MLEELQQAHPALLIAASLLALAAAAVLADFVCKRVLVRVFQLLARRSRVTWDDALVDQKVFGRLSQLAPAIVILAGIELVPGIGDSAVRLIKNVATAYLALMVTLTVVAVLAAANQIYETHPAARQRPIKGFIQVLQIIVYVFGAVLMIAALLDRSPVLLLSGFGAMTAILLLVFKDTILGLVASVQLSAQDMVRVGDWIEMPQFGADGDVVDIALHTVKVQNWDKTITTIPTYQLIAQSFKNWRGMSQSGGRRIKRALYIDQSSLRFLSDEEVEHFKRFALLRDYVVRKEEELREYHARLGAAGKEDVNRRRLTNIGMFRAYVFNYLRHHPAIHDDMTLLVRQLLPGPDGLPIEIYCFTQSTAWAVYEDIQSDIFDHVMTIVPEFGLRLYQRPAGSDLARLMPASGG
jgi:miniconductance mechanosensitive channel